MKTIQLIGGPLNGQWVVVEDFVNLYKAVEFIGPVIVSTGEAPVKTARKQLLYRQSPDCDWVFYFNDLKV